nr:ATP-binding protein [Brevibacillus fulvus]
MTIIALFAVVLTLFSLLLVQFFDSYYIREQGETLQELAKKLAQNFENSRNLPQSLQMASGLGEAYETGLIVVGSRMERLGREITPNLLPQDAEELLVTDPNLQLDKAVAGKYPAPARIIFKGDSGAPHDRQQFLAVAVPLTYSGDKHGAIVTYQAIEAIDESMLEIRKIIFVVGVLGFTLTTVFAFFLSSRIAYPLRKMKETAHQIAEGEFHAEIPIRTNDEIGELASSFNTMASRLNELVHALSNEKEQLASVLHSMVDGVMMVDADGKIVVTNPPAEHFARDWAYEHQEGNLPIIDLFRQVVATEQAVNADIAVQGRNWSIVMVPLYDRGQIRGAVAVLRDLTKERKMDKLRKDFLANVSHELRTPLSMLQGYSEAIVDGVVESREEQQELAKIIYDESVRMSRLVNELLDIARMEAGFVELSKETIALVPYLERIQRKFGTLAKERGVALRLVMDTALPSILIDPDRIEQVLTNLIDNALRHTPPEGTVTLRASGEQPLVLEVSDTGSGIPQEDLPFVFERFYKADKARTRGSAGTGLGLAIAKNIVEAHGGAINVQSKLGEGTTFIIQLPNNYKESEGTYSD